MLTLDQIVRVSPKKRVADGVIQLRHGHFLYEIWYARSRVHRAEKPAFIVYDAHKKLVLEQWYSHGRCHRIGGPAIVSHISHCKIWVKKGKWHRRDGPANESSVVTADGSRRPNYSWYLEDQNVPDFSKILLNPSLLAEYITTLHTEKQIELILKYLVRSKKHRAAIREAAAAAQTLV